MIIRDAKRGDISHLAEIDQKAYGKYGADQKYFKQKLSSSRTKILVVENKGKITGFAVFELLKKNELPKDFIDLKTTTPLKDLWTHIIVFTTETNYIDIDNDTKLVRAIENSAKQIGSTIFCVPLSIDHPFINHDVFGFWEKNGYKKIGTIYWVANSAEKIKCYFYRKS